VRPRRHWARSEWWYVGRHSQLQPGPVGWKKLEFAADRMGLWGGAAVCRRDSDGKWVAFMRACPHAGIDLLAGDIEDLGEGPIINCPAHSYLFNASTGSCLWDASRGGPPTTPHLAVFEVWQHRLLGIWVLPKPLLDPHAKEAWDQARADATQLAVTDIILDRKFPDFPK